MSAKPQQLGPPHVGTPASAISMGLRILAMALRTLFIGALVVVTVRVSSPQSETLSSVYETPGDLIRLALGFAVCLWIVLHLFMLPKDAEGYRTSALWSSRSHWRLPSPSGDVRLQHARRFRGRERSCGGRRCNGWV
jgi:hypothetical protein